VVARALGRVCVVGAQELRIDLRGRTFSARGRTISEGELITIDGKTGEILLGRPQTQPETTPPELHRVLGWADEARAVPVLVIAGEPRALAEATAHGADAGVALPSAEGRGATIGDWRRAAQAKALWILAAPSVIGAGPDVGLIAAAPTAAELEAQAQAIKASAPRAPLLLHLDRAALLDAALGPADGVAIDAEALVAEDKSRRERRPSRPALGGEAPPQSPLAAVTRALERITASHPGVVALLLAPPPADERWFDLAVRFGFRGVAGRPAELAAIRVGLARAAAGRR
jgi:hypothetical protein